MPQMSAFFAPTRNFFTGALTPGVGKFMTVPKFYQPRCCRERNTCCGSSRATDGQIHMVDGVNDQAGRFGWGSDLASVKTACGAGWQVLATSSGDSGGFGTGV